MEQPELGKNEEVTTEDTSSAKLSETETAAAPMAAEQPTAAVNGVGDTPSEDETDSTENTTAAESSDDDVPAVESAKASDDEEGEIVEEAGGLRRGQVLLGHITRTTPNE